MEGGRERVDVRENGREGEKGRGVLVNIKTIQFPFSLLFFMEMLVMYYIVLIYKVSSLVTFPDQ